MAQIKYRAGQRVSVLRGDGPQQYRIRNDSETFDRVIDESRLEADAL